MKIAIIGYGAQGKSALNYWNDGKNQLTVCDQNTDIKLPEGVNAQIGQEYLADLSGFDLVVRSPSIHPRDLAAVPPEKITTNTNEFLRICPTKNVIGVTGTKGKGTTSSLIAEMLSAAGKKVHLCGNIGIPPLELLKENIQPDDYVVLELANFQTLDLKYSPHIAVCLMVVPEHLDWHADFEEYKNAKKQLFRNQTKDDIAVYFHGSDVSKEIVSAGNAKRIAYFSREAAYVENDQIIIDDQIICGTDEVKLLGKHNLQNVCAAITAVWQITKDKAALKKVISTFGGLEHRLEFVRELDDVRYYDDSFGTTPATAIVAIEAFSQPKVLILGGSDKGTGFDELGQSVAKSSVRHAILIGDTAEVIKESIEHYDTEKNVSLTHLPGKVTMEEIVQLARSKTKPGDVVLLSTGCASFGLFANYKDRGDKFKLAALELR